MDYRKLVIRGISYSQTQSGAYALLLEHEETNIKLPIVIGNFEAHSISMKLEKDIHPPRPLTHDLFAKFVIATHHNLESVIIHQIVDGVFFSNIIFKNRDTEEELILDARTSDAVAMAICFDAPIFTTQQVLNEAGILLDLEDIEPRPNNVYSEGDFEITSNNLSSFSIEELTQILQDAVSKEDFDCALEIQEEIKKRKKKID